MAEITGFARTLILALGGAGGILLSEGLIRWLSKVTGEPEPTGWDRALVLVGGGFFGTVATHGAIHLVQIGAGKSVHGLELRLVRRAQAVPQVR